MLTVLGPGCKRCHQLNDQPRRPPHPEGELWRSERGYVTDPVAIAEAGHHGYACASREQQVISQGSARAIGDRGAPGRRKPLIDGVRSALDSRNL